MAFQKLLNFAKRVADLPDKPSSQYTAKELKEHWDSSPEELRQSLNALIDALQSKGNDCGAKNIGVKPIGTSPSNLQDMIEWLKIQIDNFALGQIPDASITPAKLSNDSKKASIINIEDTGNHFTAADVEGALKELFTLANSGKTSIANAIVSKGVPASSTDSFPVLANKIEQINTGKKWASGDAINSNELTATISVRGLEFRPSFITVVQKDSPTQEAIYIVGSAYGMTYNKSDEWTIAGAGPQHASSNCVIYDDGFDINNPYPGKLARWIAFE